VSSSKQIFESILRKHGNVYCVWTGNPLLQYEVDHLIPFSIWKNNDLWNLFPSSKRTNNQKRDKIPSVEMINKRRDSIFYYWDLLNLDQPVRFLKEIQISLLGKNEPKNWKETAFNHLTNSCNYLINQRGYSEWNI
jgi:hypothetical protein